MERKKKLLANNNVEVKFALVSIGKPEIGLELCKHLGIDDDDDDDCEVEEWIFADPENDAYDRLMLNRGWDTMISPATAFRFKDRIFGNNGGGGGEKGSMKQLFAVLGKWKDAVYLPPKLEQSTNHGGTFIFDGDDVVFAHYDEAPGTHADTYEVLDIVEKTVAAATKAKKN